MTPDLRWTDAYRAISYQARASSPDGVDCWGLVRLVALTECGLTIPDLSPAQSGLRAQFGAFETGASGAPAVKDGGVWPLHAIVLLARPGARAAIHAGIHAGGGFVLHATKDFGVRLDDLVALEDLTLQVLSVHDISVAAEWLSA